MRDTNHSDRLRALIAEGPVALLATIDAEGRPVARPMLPLLLDDDPRIHFLTHRGSAKVGQVEARPDVAIAMVCSGGIFLSLTGRAVVARDARLIGQLWHPSYRAWFPDGQQEQDAAVLSVNVDGADLWEAPTSRVTRLFSAVRALLTHESVETPKQHLEHPLQGGDSGTR